MRRLLALVGCALLSIPAAPAVAGEPLDPHVADEIREYVEGILAELDVPGAGWASGGVRSGRG